MKKPYLLYKRKDRGGTFYIQFDFIPGSWYSSGTRNRDEAIIFAEQFIRKETRADSKRNMTLAKFASNFFSPEDPHGYRNRNIKRHVFRSEEYYSDCAARLRNYILPHHGAYLLHRLTDIMIEDFILNLKSVKNPQKELDDSSKNKVLSVYRIILQEAVREGYMDRNVANDVKEINEIKGNRLPFSEEEVSLLFPEDKSEIIKIWGSLRWAAYFSLLKDTGWRPGTAAALRRSHFYPSMAGTSLNGVYSDEEVSWRTHKIVHRIKTSDTKNGAKSLQGFVSENTASILNDLCKATDKEYLFEFDSDENKKSHRRTERDSSQLIYAELANKVLRTACKKAGVVIGKRTQYSFRHYFSTYHFGRLPEMARLLLMGHTKNRSEYTHITPEQALERLIEIEGVKKAFEKT